MVYVLQFSWNRLSDSSLFPLLDGDPIGLHTRILAIGYPNGLCTAMLV